jgi:DNA-binding SARP family transcriptional activator/TolB-like protein
MFTLRVFGGVSLEEGGRPVVGRATQKRRLALLSILSASPAGTVSRDKLIACLWPEAGTEQARRLLSSSLYDLRKGLGDDVITAAGDDLRLNPARLHAEVADFDGAMAAGDWARAVAVYAGPFGDGFFVSDADEFERWLESQRQKYADLYREALERLAGEQEASGDLLGWVGSWRRLAAQDPFNARIAIRLMKALDAVGDRAAALRHARVHEALLREELGAAPDPEVVALATRLREAPEAPPRSGDGLDGASALALLSDRPLPFPAGPLPVPAGSDPPPTPSEPGVAGPAAGAGAGRPRRIGRRERAIMVGALVVVLIAGMAISVWPVRPVEAHSTRIAVLPFAYHGSPEYEYLGPGMVDLLSANIDGTGGLRSVDPRAVLAFARQPGARASEPDRRRAVGSRFGAGHVVLGSISEAGGRLRISASLYESDGRSEPVTTVVVEGEAGELFELIDRLTGRLLADGLIRHATRLDGLAVVTTASIPALKSYLEGTSLLRQGSFEAAVDVFEQTVAMDSTFALAYYRLSIAASWAKRFDLTRHAAARAVHHGDRLARRDRLLLDGVLAIHEGRPDDAEANFRDLLGAYPSDVEGWLQLGEVLFHYNPLRGRHPAESLAAWERALELEPGNRFAYAHIGFVAAEQEDVATLNRAHRALAAAGNADPLTLTVGLLAALAARDTVAESRVMEQLRRADAGAITEAVWTAMLMSREFAGVSRAALLLDDAERPTGRFVADRIRLAHLHMSRGQWTRADEQLRLMEPRDSVAALVHRALAAGVEFTPLRPGEIHSLLDRLERWDPALTTGPGYYAQADLPIFRLYLLGLLHIRLGDLEAGERYAHELWRLPEPVDPVLAQDLSLSLRGQVTRRRGEPQIALSLFEQIRSTGTPYNRAMGSPIRARSYERYLRAELLRELGHLREALALYETLGTLSPLETMYLPPISQAQARIHADLGDRTRARAHHARFLDLSRAADPATLAHAR